MYDLLILGSLLSGDKSAYKLQHIVGLALRPVRKVSNGVLFPVLERLEKEGLIVSELQQSGRKVKMIHLTDKGYEQYLELMKQPVYHDAKRDDVMHFKLLSISSVPQATQIAILEQYRDFSLEDAEGYRKAGAHMTELKSLKSEFGAHYDVVKDVYELDRDLAEMKVAWAEKKLQKLRNK